MKNLLIYIFAGLGLLLLLAVIIAIPFTFF